MSKLKLNDKFSNSLDGEKIFYFAFIFDSIVSVKKKVWSILDSGFNNKCKMEEFDLINFSQIINYLTFTRTRNIKCLIWQPSSVEKEFVVFCNNQSDGWYTFVNEYVDKYQAKIIRVAFSGNKSEYPVYSFDYINKNIRRELQVIKYVDDKWEFFSKGKLMRFEETNYYKARSIRNRLNNVIIESYLKRLGLKITEDDFWTSRGKAVDFTVDFSKK